MSSTLVTTTPTASLVPSGSISTSSSNTAVQRKRANMGAGFDAQERALAPVQRKGGEDTEGVHEAAGRGMQGGAGALPFADKIQKSFGAHDVGHVKAHTGAAAREASSAMGAKAYATGDHVVFGETPDLHTAAHEAAHVVQQRAGVSLAGGVGQEGDSYEKHADRVADKVVKGESAEALLSEMSGGAKSARTGGVQRRNIQRRQVQRDTGGPVVGGGVGSTGMGLASDEKTYGPRWGAPPEEQAEEEARFRGYLANPTSHPAYASIFLPRVERLFQIAGMDLAGAEPMASGAWTEAFAAISATEADTASVTTGGRTDLEALKTRIGTASESVIERFQGLANIVEPALDAQFLRCNSFAFWSKQCALHLAMNGGADLALETSALGGLFNGLNISGDNDIQLWAGLSTYYARAIVEKAKGKEVRVFAGPGAAKDNIYTKIEFPELEEAFNQGEIDIVNYAVAPLVDVVQKDASDPHSWAVEVNTNVHDPKETGGGIPGTYAQEPGGLTARSKMIDEAGARFQARKDAAQAEVDQKNTPPATPPS